MIKAGNIPKGAMWYTKETDTLYGGWVKGNKFAYEFMLLDGSEWQAVGDDSEFMDDSEFIAVEDLQLLEEE